MIEQQAVLQEEEIPSPYPIEASMTLYPYTGVQQKWALCVIYVGVENTETDHVSATCWDRTYNPKVTNRLVERPLFTDLSRQETNRHVIHWDIPYPLLGPIRLRVYRSNGEAVAEAVLEPDTLQASYEDGMTLVCSMDKAMNKASGTP